MMFLLGAFAKPVSCALHSCGERETEASILCEKEAGIARTGNKSNITSLPPAKQKRSADELVLYATCHALVRLGYGYPDAKIPTAEARLRDYCGDLAWAISAKPLTEILAIVLHSEMVLGACCWS